MQLREWISELNGAATERDLVCVMRAFLRHVRRESSLPDECLPAEPGDAAAVRAAASAIVRLQLAARVAHRDVDFYQQLLILFSLAADRVSLLEGRGLLTPPAAAPSHAIRVH